jgi:hypothetical protein
MRDVHRKPAMALVQTRWTFTWMRGPMTRAEIRSALVKPAMLQPVPAASGVVGTGAGRVLAAEKRP